MSELRRVGAGDALIGLSLLALILAGLLPTFRQRAFDRLVEDAATDVEALRTAALTQREVDGSWPPAAPPGRVPDVVSGAFGGDTVVAREGYALQWRLWDRVAYVEAPPRSPGSGVADDDEAAVEPTPRPGDLPPDSVGPEMMPVVRQAAGVVVHSSDESLLAELLARYGSDVSFVLDSTWTLVVEPDS